MKRNIEIIITFSIAAIISSRLSVSAFTTTTSTTGPSTLRSSKCLPTTNYKTAATTTSLQMSGVENQVEPLAREGPWQAFLDESTTGLIYYFNSNTGESMWDPPTPTFPKIRMTRREKRRMMEIRQNYAEVQRLEMEQKAMEEEEERKQKQGDGVGGFLKGFMGGAGNAGEVSGANGVNGDVTEQEAAIETEADVKSAPPAFEIPNLGGFMANFNKPPPQIEQQELVEYEEEVYDNYEEELYEEEEFEEPIIKPLRVEVATKVLPHPEKVSWGGEDALFSQGRTFGIFDGVSGAEKVKGAPLYSVTLSRQLKTSVGRKGLTAEELQQKLLVAAELADDAATGASTALMASMGEDGFLRVLNVGDSVLIVVRNGAIASKTREIVHYFDCPYQLSSDSPDRPKDGTVMNVEIVPGDIIVTGSDGVFDNLSEEAICEIVSGKGSAMSFAKKIADESRRISFDTKAETPYAKLAKRNRYPEYRSGLGGKVDDISCVVVRCT